MNVKRSREEHPVQEYFIFDKESNKSTCNIGNCTFFASGRHSNNLAKHIQRHHRNQCAELAEATKEFNERCKRACKKPIEHVTVKINRKEFQNGILELVNINGRPFSITNDSGMLKVISPILAAFKSINEPISISREVLQKQSLQKCENLIKCISEEIMAYFNG